jgi:hypothetical protein
MMSGGGLRCDDTFTGNPLPVEVTLPSLLDEEDEEPRKPAEPEPVSVNKGKRKAPPE